MVYSSSNPQILEINGSVAEIKGDGNVTISAYAPATSTHSAAEVVSKTFFIESNLPPTDLNSTATLAFHENQPIGTIVGQFNATDREGGEVSYLLFNKEGATTLTFDTGQGANDDLSSTFGSNLSSSIDGAMISGIGTPDISLAWTAATHVFEVHGPAYWDHLDASDSGVDVLQLDLGGGDADPFITFSVGSDSALFLDSVVIGHADNMHENPNNWTLSISKEGGEEVFSKTTSLMARGIKNWLSSNLTVSLDRTTSSNLLIMDPIILSIDNLKFEKKMICSPSITTAPSKPPPLLITKAMPRATQLPYRQKTN